MGTRLYAGLEWVMRLVYVQFLWMVFSVFGLGIFGFFPATVSMFTVMRKWIRGESEAGILDTFKKTWMREWKKANIIGWVFTGIGFVLFFYLKAAIGMSGITGIIFYLLMAMALVIYTLSFLFVFPVYVHFHAGAREAMKLALLLALSFPFHSISMLAAAAGFYFLTLFLPSLLPFISFSLLGFALMGIADLAFAKAGEKEEQRMQTEA
ncbi:DUF624 domain-containing protein [Bacillus sp. FJAT-42376]|uniref:YesL family protein n=1 Tax=Bacillus sp. FJAT-42376 TaxID=2014076 RepID=UPI000F4D8C60|nr:DUF624 domain-containing protein [Bacillus sp. FJAT-42376]AZB42480.1 DUF624 domain-containing protein [Bacillus sp. FJAT-42376]